jgi:hypothetical protein
MLTIINTITTTVNLIITTDRHWETGPSPALMLCRISLITRDILGNL